MNFWFDSIAVFFFHIDHIYCSAHNTKLTNDNSEMLTESHKKLNNNQYTIIRNHENNEIAQVQKSNCWDSLHVQYAVLLPISPSSFIFFFWLWIIMYMSFFYIKIKYWSKRINACWMYSIIIIKILTIILLKNIISWYVYVMLFLLKNKTMFIFIQNHRYQSYIYFTCLILICVHFMLIFFIFCFISFIIDRRMRSVSGHPHDHDISI